MTDEDRRADEVEVTLKSSTAGARSEMNESSSTEEAPSAEPNVVAAARSESGDHAHGDHAHGDGGHGDGGHGDHGHGQGGHEDHDEHLGHTAPISILVGVLIALGMLTILTVAVTAVDLGSQGNFVVAMIIATVKAILVMGYFMHMFWDARFNVVAFTSSFLFVLLFLAMTVLDGSEYQQDVKDYQNDKKVQM